MKKIWLITLLMLLLHSANLFSQSKADKNFEKLASEILDDFQKFYPVHASEKGIHTYDYLVTDYSKKAVKNEIARLKKFERRLYNYNKVSLTDEHRIDQKLLKSNLDIALQDLSKIKWHQRNPYLYINDAVNSVYFLLISEHAPLNERVQNILARMKAIPDLFVQAEENLKNPPPIYIDLAREMVITGTDFFNSVRVEMSKKFPELASEINNAANRVEQSLKEYDNFLANCVPGDESSFAIGKEDFDYKLEHEYFLNYDSDSLLKIGQNLFNKYDSAYRALDEWLLINEPVDSVYVPDCIDKKEILNYYKWELNEVIQFLNSKDIVSIPDNIGKCKIIETPDVFLSVIPDIAYQMPGTFNSDQTGYFYVSPISEILNKEDKNYYYRRMHDRAFRRSVVHEAYPGHHFQLQMASRNDSDVRKWHSNIGLMEGWALYCEEMMYQNGLYGNDKHDYLKILGGIRFRAARIILDVKLHTGQISREDATNWLVELWGGYEDYARTEVNRYTMSPTYQMNYLIGKGQILDLLDDYKKKEGDNFSLKQFHDRLLLEGSIPVPLIQKSWGLTK